MLLSTITSVSHDAPSRLFMRACRNRCRANFPHDCVSKQDVWVYQLLLGCGNYSHSRDICFPPETIWVTCSLRTFWIFSLQLSATLEKTATRINTQNSCSVQQLNSKSDIVKSPKWGWCGLSMKNHFACDTIDLSLAILFRWQKYARAKAVTRFISWLKSSPRLLREERTFEFRDTRWQK